MAGGGGGKPRALDGQRRKARGRGGWAAASSYWSLQLRHSRETALGSSHVTPTTGCARHRTIVRLFLGTSRKGGAEEGFVLACWCKLRRWAGSKQRVFISGGNDCRMRHDPANLTKIRLPRASAGQRERGGRDWRPRAEWMGAGTGTDPGYVGLSYPWRKGSRSLCLNRGTAQLGTARYLGVHARQQHWDNPAADRGRLTESVGLGVREDEAREGLGAQRECVRACCEPPKSWRAPRTRRCAKAAVVHTRAHSGAC